MTPLWAADILDEATQLFAQGDEDFIFILNRFCSELWVSGSEQHGGMGWSGEGVGC